MSRIRMKVFIRNESDATLTFARGELESGDYTPGWVPPPVIGPGERKGFQGEGDIVPIDVPFTGTEGRVWYRIVSTEAPGELYIHWNSPLVEFSYGNTFHIWGPENWEVSHWGGQGHHAELEIRLRPTAFRTVPNFHPNGRGFLFSNTNWSSSLPVMSVGYLYNRLLDSMPEPVANALGIARVLDENALPFTRADAGLCGGMVFAVMDYHHHHLLPPAQSARPSSRDDELFTYLRDRLFDSFDVTGGGHRYLGYSSPHYPNGDAGAFQAIGLTRGRSWISYREEWPRIQADIDAGRLSPMALIQSTNLDIGRNHQVLAYAYERSGQDVTLYVYDPNFTSDHGPQGVTLKFDLTRTDGEVHMTRSHGAERIWCFFRTNGYVPKQPPQGRRITSVRDAVGASRGASELGSLRGATSGTQRGGSVTQWMRTL